MTTRVRLSKYVLIVVVASFSGNVVSSGDAGGKWKLFEGYGDWSKPNTLSISPMKRWDFGCSVEVKLVVNEHYVLSAGYRRGLLEQQDYYKLNANSLRFSIGYIL